MLEQAINSWPAVSRHPRVSSTVLVIGCRGAPECEIAKVFVTCTEVITQHEAFITVEYTTSGRSHASTGKGSLAAGVNRYMNTASIGATDGFNRGFITVTPDALQGHRLGTYLMWRVVQFLHQFPDAQVNPIRLSDAQAYRSNRVRRNRFYEQVGLQFDYYDEEHENGRSRPARAGDLILVETWKQNIQELRMGDYLKHQDSHVRGLCHEISTLENRCSSLQNALDDARRRPIRWGVATFIAKHLNIIGPAVLVMMAALAAYKALNGESS
ncbi:hypothetical protein NOX69_005101 [Pseudomonas aeruginosa]|nr:hypothetical protein [Pseudomonas aeruginosa]